MAKVEDCPGFETFGADVKAAREAKRLARKTLAEMVGIEWRYLANIENQGAIPSLPVMIQLIKVCGLPVERCLTLSPQLRQNYGKVLRHTFRLDLRQICKQIALQRFPCNLIRHILSIEFVVAVRQPTGIYVVLDFRSQHLSFPFGFRRTTRRKLLLHDCLM